MHDAEDRPGIRFRPLLAGWDGLMGHHHALLEDRVRSEAMIGAIEAQVRAGDVVCDLGTGTGLLAMAAARAGARRVYAIELARVAALARQVIHDNGYGDIIEVLACHSGQAELPEPVDVLVSECFGIIGLGSTMIPWLCELRDRVMRPEGQVIPRAVEVWAAPVESRACARFVASAGAPRYGFTFAAARAYALNNLYSAEFQPGQLVAAPARLIQRSLVVGEHHSGAARGVSRARCTRDAELCGLAAWFSAELGAGHTLTTAPGEPSTVWRQVLLPIEPLAVRAGQTIELELRFAREPERLFDISWRVDVGDRRAGGSTGASYPTWGPR